MQLGDAATWVAALGTFSAVAVALWESGKEGRRHRTEERVAQAGLVSVWFSKDIPQDHSEITVNNSSEQPIYEVVTTLTVNSRPSESTPGEYRAVVPTLPPGRWTFNLPTGWTGMSAYPTAEVGFTDHRGRHWIRRATGKLEELNQSAIDHLDVYRPFAIAHPRPGREA